MHLVGFTIEIYHDARPYMRQIWGFNCNGYRLPVYEADLSSTTAEFRNIGSYNITLQNIFMAYTDTNYPYPYHTK